MSTFEQTTSVVEVCACCGEAEAHLTAERMSFRYGEKGVQLEADIPVWECAACGERYSAEGAEEAERAAICAHLGRLTPGQIVEIRKASRLTQEAFSREVGIGRVTLARWETGQQLQSAVYDRLIRQVANRPDAQGVSLSMEAREQSLRDRPRPVFRTPVEHRRPAAHAFQLVGV